MDSKTMVDRYEAKLEGQQLLWEDHDIVLRNTKFKPIDTEFDREALVHWWMNVYVPDGYRDQKTPQDVFSSWHNAMYRCFKYVNVGGYNPNTNQSAIKISCVKKSPLEPQVAELKMWLPYMKPSLDENGSGKRQAKHVGIFESTLSEHGSYSMCIYDDKEYVVDVIRYHRWQLLQKFDNLDAAVDYIRTNLWYKKRANDD